MFSACSNNLLTTHSKFVKKQLVERFGRDLEHTADSFECEIGIGAGHPVLDKLRKALKSFHHSFHIIVFLFCKSGLFFHYRQ